MAKLFSAAVQRFDPTRAWLVALCFVVALAQDPLYTENQNTKFLQGAAAAGHGFLAQDWMSDTADPLPVFSKLIEWLFQGHVQQLALVLFALLAGLYAWTLVRIVRASGMLDVSRTATAAWFGAGFLIAHGLSKTWPEGLAEQYLLGSYFQPCVFGVLLLYAVLLYLEAKPFVAMVALALAAAVHPDYLPSTTVCAFVFAFTPGAGERFDARQGVLRLAVYLALVVPIAFTLQPILQRTSAADWSRAIEILTRIRIPQHASVHAWFDAEAAGQLVVMIAGTAWARGRLRIAMVALCALTIVPIVLLAVFDVPALEAITPWRASVFLMPLAITVLLARGVEKLGNRGERWAVPVWLLVAVVAIGVGLERQVSRAAKYANAPSMPAIDYARAHAQAGQTYLVPPRPSEFRRFRLETGVPIVVNWKTHPYRDVELIEWYARFQAAEAVYVSKDAREACGHLRAVAQRYGATHVVLPSAHPLASAACGDARRVWSDRNYQVWQLSTSAETAANGFLTTNDS